MGTTTKTTATLRSRTAVPSVLALAAGAGLACCAAGCFGGGREPARLTSNDPASRIPAIRKAADGTDVDPRGTQTASHLVVSLESDDPAVRFFAIRGLQSLTGETFGYVWYADDGERRASVQQWKQWLGTDAAKAVAGGNGKTE